MPYTEGEMRKITGMVIFTHARTHAHAHTHTHTQFGFLTLGHEYTQLPGVTVGVGIMVTALK